MFRGGVWEEHTHTHTQGEGVCVCVNFVVLQKHMKWTEHKDGTEVKKTPVYNSGEGSRLTVCWFDSQVFLD